MIFVEPLFGTPEIYSLDSYSYLNGHDKNPYKTTPFKQYNKNCSLLRLRGVFLKSINGISIELIDFISNSIFVSSNNLNGVRSSDAIQFVDSIVCEH